MITVAALYVDPKGPYFKMPGVECWDEARDARLYAGPHPVVAHPPCERWGHYWHGGPNSVKFPRVRRKLGDDADCFKAAIAAVRKYGGVLEHPAYSHAWKAFGIDRPPLAGDWIKSACGGYTCHLEQGNYGHKARKATWLYYVGNSLPVPALWGRSFATAKLDDGFHSAEERRLAKLSGGKRSTGTAERLTKFERKATPQPFADYLVALARHSVA